MTRETKIGLLVGLAFIIVIGILLSDHMSNSTELPQAALNNTGNTVMEGVTNPAAAATDAPSGDTVVITQPVTPRKPVMTRREASSPTGTVATPGQSIVNVGPGNAGTPVQIQQTSPPPGPAATDPTPVVTGHDAPPTEGSLVDIAHQHGMDIVPAGTHSGAAPASAGAQKHVAEAGDTLSKWAGRFMGGNSKAARDAIVKANPTLAADPNRIIVGRTYIIPAVSVAPAAASTPSSAAPMSPVTPPSAAPVAVNTTWYTVKSNDSLWSIASERLGNGSAYTAIKELNKDILKGSDTVTVNMRLRLPASKPVASAH